MFSSICMRSERTPTSGCETRSVLSSHWCLHKATLCSQLSVDQLSFPIHSTNLEPQRPPKVHLKGLTLWNNIIHSFCRSQCSCTNPSPEVPRGPERLTTCQDVAANCVVIYVCSEFIRSRQLLLFGTSTRIIKLTLEPCQSCRSRPPQSLPSVPQ